MKTEIPKIKSKTKLLVTIIAVLYPLLIFFFRVVFKLPPRYVSVFIVIFAVAYFIVNGKHYKGKKTIFLFISPSLLLGIGLVCFFTDDEIVLKFYPALADFFYLIILGTSLIIPPPLASYLVKFVDKSAQGCLTRGQFETFCKSATKVWCAFFVVDCIIAVVTAFLPKDFILEILKYKITANDIWIIYNGVITYVLMAVLFAVEFIVLKSTEKDEWLKQNALEAHNENC